MKGCCDMKGFLSFLVLHLISQKELSGTELMEIIRQRKGAKPSPGTIYPVLKSLKEDNLIAEKKRGREKIYKVTAEGKRAVAEATKRFTALFCDIRNKF